jgi:hypothetical protein
VIEREAVVSGWWASRNLDFAGDASRQNDLYVLHTVFFALALFFFGATSEVRRGGMRRFSLAFGAVILAATLVSLARLPRASSVFDHGGAPLARGPAPGQS